jgi:hypothetical protein
MGDTKEVEKLRIEDSDGRVLIEGMQSRDFVDILKMFRAIVDAVERGDLVPDAPGINRDSLHALAHRIGWV